MLYDCNVHLAYEGDAYPMVLATGYGPSADVAIESAKALAAALDLDDKYESIHEHALPSEHAGTVGSCFCEWCGETFDAADLVAVWDGDLGSEETPNAVSCIRCAVSEANEAHERAQQRGTT